MSNFASAYPDNSAGAGLLLLRLLLGFSGFQEAWRLRGVGNGPVIAELDLSIFIITLALLMGWQTRLAASLFFIAFGVTTLWIGRDAGVDSLNRFTNFLLPAGTALASALLGPGSYSMDARRFGRHEIVIEPLNRNS